MQVIKRQGNLVEFDSAKIRRAIEKAMSETKTGVDENLSQQITAQIEKKLQEKNHWAHVEEIQDLVEYYLMESPRKDAAKQYIVYRWDREKARIQKNADEYVMITDAFISKFKHLPSPLRQLGNFVYYRTYSRYLPQMHRREYWWETVRRAVEYNTSLVPTSREEAEKLFENIFNLRQFLSGRVFWVGNTPVTANYPMANYNCAFTIIDSFKSFKDLFYLLMIGSGVGVRILKEDVKFIPKVHAEYELIHRDYIPVATDERDDNTSFIFNKHTAEIRVGDSKEGWVQALGYFFELISSYEYKNIRTIIIDYSHVRPKGEKLKTFGGTASGHESLKNMFRKIDKVIRRRYNEAGKMRVNLRPIDCLDIANIIGENVVVGGVRRTAEMIIIDAEDQECIEAKSNLYKQADGKWIVNQDLVHRQMSNNSIYYTGKPSREKLKWQLQRMRYSGEPGWINHEAAAKRRPNMNGVNPCGEILLDSKGLCNLTTINVYSFVRPDGTLDLAELLEAQRLSARAAYRMTCVELELPDWDIVQRRDRLLGCSLTGWQDMVNALNMDKDDQAKLLRQLRDIAHQAAKDYAHELGLSEPLLVTTVKPEGTLSQLPTVSSGVHYAHSPYFIRRVRVSSDDPMAKVCEELGYPMFPEVGQKWETCTTKVIEFPVQAPDGVTKYDISAIKQLENYVDHNCSITVSVRNDEWEAVEDWVWNNWDKIVAVSFLPLDDSFYELLPYEAITKDEFERRQADMKPFIPSLLTKYESGQGDYELENDNCENGICPIR